MRGELPLHSQVVPGVIMMVVALAIPESPRWLIERYPDGPERALRVLAKLRQLTQHDETVQAEFFEMQGARQYRLEHGQDYTRKQFLSKYAIWKRFRFGMATMALGQISGIGALMLYGITAFEGLGFSSAILSLLLNVVVGILSLVAVYLAAGGVDR